MTAIFNANERIKEARKIAQKDGYNTAILYLAEQEVVARGVDLDASLFLKSNRAQMLNQAKRPEEALALCDKALEKYPERTAFLRIKRSALLYLGRKEEAKIILKRLNEIEPDRRHAMTFGETREQFADALPAEDAESAAGALAYLCSHFGPKPLELIAMLNEATKPENFGQTAATAKGSYDIFLPRLVAALEKMHAAEPDNFGALIALGFAYRSVHAMPKMRNAFHTAYALDPNKETTIYGWAVSQGYRSEERRAAMRKLFSRFPNPAYGCALAVEYLAVYNVQEAIPVLQRVLAAHPAHRHAASLLIKSYLQTHNFAESGKLLTTADIPEDSADQMKICSAFVQGNLVVARTSALKMLERTYDRTVAAIAMVSILERPNLLEKFKAFLKDRSEGSISEEEFQRAQHDAQTLVHRAGLALERLFDYSAERNFQGVSGIYGQAHREPYSKAPITNIGRNSYRPRAEPGTITDNRIRRPPRGRVPS